MKKIMLLLLLASGCAPHNHKAQDAIITYMRTTAKAPGSYVPISFGEPHATSPPTASVLINHVYQDKDAIDSLVIASNLFRVDSVAGTAEVAKPAPGAN